MRYLPLSLIAFMAVGPDCWCDGDADPKPNDENPGSWVLIQSTTVPAAIPPTPINRVFTNAFGAIVNTETSSGMASGNRPVTLSITSNTTSSNIFGDTVANAGSGSLTEQRTWEWQPANAPIQNKDVAMSLTGTATATVSVSISGNDGGDGASSSVSFDASGSGIVGGTPIVGMSVGSKSIAVDAFISKTTASGSTRLSIKGEAKKTAGSGEVTASQNDNQEFVGTPTKSQSLTISATINGIGNTNNIRTYTISLSQGVTGSVAASNSAFDTSSSSLVASSNFDFSPKN